VESKPYDIVLLPEPTITKRAVQLSRTIEHQGTYFTLGKNEYFPHVSLYMLQLNTEGLREAEVYLETIVNNTETVEGQADAYHYEKGYFDIEYRKTTELTDLQDKVVEKLNPIRDELRAKDKERLLTTTGEEKANIEKYGYRNVGKLFAPHLTFTRFKDAEINSLNDLPPTESFSGTFVALGIFEMGDHGTCRWKIKDWGLKQ